MEPGASTQHSFSSLLHQLKTLEQVRRDELASLDEINRRQLAHTNGDSMGVMDEYRRAIALAQQEQKAARRALEAVAQLLAKQSKDDSDNDGELRDTSPAAELRAKRRRLESKSGENATVTMMRRESRSRESRSREPRGRDRDRSDRDGRDSRDRSERDRGDRDSRDYYDRDGRDRGDRESRDRDRDRSRGHRDRLREKEKERDRLQQRRRRDNTIAGSTGGNGTEKGSGSNSLSRGRSSGLMEAEIENGCLVAARVSPATADQAEMWILSTVLSYNSEKNRYTVQDEDEESPDRPTYVLSARYVLFVSAEPNATTPAARRRRWDRSRNPEMSRGQRVLAMYPGTTSFYTGQVATPPSLNTNSSPVLGAASLADPAEPPADPTSNPMYRIQFDDDDGKERNVPAHLVVPQPRSSGSNSSS